MQSPRSAARLLSTLLVATSSLIVPAQLAGQGAPQQTAAAKPLALGRDQIVTLAKAEAAIVKVRDSIYKQLTLSGNKRDETQRNLREKMNTQVDEALHHLGLTRESYAKLSYVVSVDSAVHRVFDSVFVAVTGAPLATQVQAATVARTAAAANAPVVVPAGPAGTHIGHVVNAFTDTPNGMGLLPAALAEARTANQHATLGARSTTDLANMQLHAGHVLNALDPTLVQMGPGLGYGMKKAALAAANHIDLAAKAQGASPNIITHSMHIGTAAKAAANRADEAIDIAKKIQAATTAADAAALMSQLISVTGQLVSGVDANGDGRIDWQDPEGGLQQAQDHVTLMIAGEALGGR